MTNDELMTKHKSRKSAGLGISRRSAFVIRASSFLSRPPPPGNFRQTQDSLENLVRRRVFDLVDGDRIGDVEAAGFRPAKRFQMRAATERFANVVNIGADIKAFAANPAKID